LSKINDILCINELHINDFTLVVDNNIISNLKDIYTINICLENDNILMINNTKNAIDITEEVDYIYIDGLLQSYKSVCNKRSYINIYMSLKTIYKNAIINHMNDLQKIFISLTILFELIDRDNGIKYCLVEEPELHLTYYKLKKYISILAIICDVYDVNLIVMTDDKYILSGTEEVKNISYVDYVISNVHKSKSKSSSVDDERYINCEYLLVVEGTNELGVNGFFTKLRELYPVLHNFYMMTKSYISNNIILANLSKQYKEIIYITDA